MLSRKILVVDDEATFVDSCRTTLGNLGYNIICASTGEQAIELSTNSSFDLILINNLLAGSDGLETFAMLRQLEPNIIGILIIGDAETRIVIEAVNAGFNGILEKPVDPAKLIKAVQEALVIARLRDENTRMKILFPLYQLGQKFLSATSADQIYKELVHIIHKEIQAPCVSVMMHDKESGVLKIVASQGLTADVAKNVRLKPGEKIAGWVFTHGQPIILNRKDQHESFLSNYLQRKEIAASISFPLTIRGEVAGVVNISHRDSHIEYSAADMEMLSVICSHAVLALENVMALMERERAVRLRTLFEQYVAPEVAEFLISRKEKMLDVGEVRDVTVLFADIRNFTGLVQHISPDQLRVFLNQFFELFTNIVFAARGTLDKFMGDAALVLFGAPVPIAEPAVSAVETAIKILSNFEVLKRQWLQKFSWFESIGIGIGITSGEVYLGNVGSERRLDFTVIGTNVNIAQRLAAENNSGQILITESVNSAVSGKFKVIKEGSRLLRGLEQELQIYSISPQSDIISKP